MDLHFIINCIAGFSFLSSAGFMAFIRIPYAPVWRKLRWCKTFLSLTFLVVGLSCSKTVVFGLGSNPSIIQTSTLISASIQSLLFACTGISFLNPTFINRKWIWQNISASTTRQDTFPCVVISIGLSMTRRKTCYLSKQNLHGIGRNSSRRLTTFWVMSFPFHSDAPNVDAKSITLMTKATTSLKNVAFHQQENPSRMLAMMSMTQWQTQSRNGAVR